MRRLFCIILLSLSIFSTQAQSLSAQEANKRVGELINASDFKTLGRELPALRANVVEPLLALADALVAYNEGRHEESNRAISKVSEYAPELGSEVVFNMLQLSIYNYLALEQYQEGKAIAELILQTLPDDGVSTDASTQARTAWESTLRWTSALAEREKLVVERAEGDVVLSVEVRAMGRGEHLVLRTKVGEHEQDAILDTGCSFANLISSAAAEKLGVEVVADEIILHGFSKGYARLGFLPEMHLGDVVIRNATFFVVDQLVPENVPVDGMCDMVLGSHLIRKLGEMRIEPKAGKIILPAHPSVEPKERNLSFGGGQYYLNCKHSGEELLLHFDTGNVKTQLSSRYFSRFQSEVETEGGEVERSRSGGFGGVVWCDVRSLPKVKLEIEDKELHLKEVGVNLPTQYEDGEMFVEQYDGAMGVDMITSAEQVTLDLERMFFRIDK